MGRADAPDLISIASAYTKSPLRLASLAKAIEQIDRNKIAGDIVECGVWRGGNIILSRLLSPQRVCWLYDTFQGMTEPTELDTKRGGRPALPIYHAKKAKGWSRASIEEVVAGLRETNTYDETKLRFVVGDVCETLCDSANRPRKIALLRLDTDWHASTKMELETLYPRLQKGGILIVDDYGHWSGARKAVDDYFGPNVKIEMLDYTAAQIVKC